MLQGREIVCTLTSPGYWGGTGVLVNSLFRSGFEGEIAISHRGSREGWATKPLPKALTDRIELRYLPVDYEGHLTYWKADVMLAAFEAQDVERVFFFDSDIVVHANWPSFSAWADVGIALCQDVSRVGMQPNHPVRAEWSHALAELGVEAKPVFGYANGGFLGIRRENMSFLHLWRNLLDNVDEKKGGLDSALLGPIWSPYCAGDQDFLNIAMMGTDCPLSMTGQEGMGFVPGQSYMSHAIGATKPWNAKPLRTVIRRGIKPKASTKSFWRNANYPVQVYSPPRVYTERAAIAIASLIGRIVAS